MSEDTTVLEDTAAVVPIHGLKNLGTRDCRKKHLST